MTSVTKAVRFDYDEAFSRNLGWLSPLEQCALRGKTVAIGGAGGVGGIHATTLARLGLGGFRLADPDTFELANFNRQAGARMSTLGRRKVEVIAESILDINPTARVQTFGALDDENIDEFLRGADLFIDGLDFFVSERRRRVCARCAELGIPVITAGPMGMSVAYLSFVPGGMSFDDYFGMRGVDEQEQRLRFLVGLAPKALHRATLVDPTRVRFTHAKGPSTPMAVGLCASVVGVEAVKILCGRGELRPAPWYHQFDPFTGRWVRRRAWLGHRSPLFRLKCWLARRVLASIERRAPPLAEPEAETDLEHILELARWAPSGDNEQPWRFELREPDDVVVHVAGARTFYQLDGRAPLVAAGCLLTTLELASSRFGRRVSWRHEPDGEGHRFIVHTEPDAALIDDPLSSAIEARAVDRRPFRTTPLRPADKAALEAAAAPDFEVRWFESGRARRSMTTLNVAAAAIRLRSEGAFEALRRYVDFERDFSPDKMPSSSLGMSPLSLMLMRWGFHSFARLRWLMRLGGYASAHLELDVRPGLSCAAHFALVRRGAHDGSSAADVHLGRAFQRFWLTATQLGLVLQPSYSPVAFSRYARLGIGFTHEPGLRRRAEALERRMAALFPDVPRGNVEMLGRLGFPRGMAPGRSLRLPLSQLRR